MSVYAAVPALVGVALLGWLSGMVTLTRSSRWCKTCGRTLMCPSCAPAANPTASRPGPRPLQ
jgi:hypothetical protein